MTHYYEKNIVDIKSEYTSYLINILVPLIYEGFQSIYNHAIDIHEQIENNDRTQQHPDLTKIFQICLRDIPALNQIAIENEVKRIKEFSRCSEIFDDLIKAVMKSYIILLTFNASGKTCKLVSEKYHDKVNINDFIHKCYVECANIFYNNPELFWHGHDKDTQILCKNNSYDYIRQGIIEAIHKSLPIKDILREYLTNDYIVDDTKNNNNDEEKHKHRHMSDINSLSDQNDLSEQHNSESIKKQVRQIVGREGEGSEKSENAHSHHSEHSHHKSDEKHDDIGAHDVGHVLMPVENRVNTIGETAQPIQPIQPIINANSVVPNLVTQQQYIPPMMQQTMSQPMQNPAMENPMNMIGGELPMDNDKIDKFFENFLN